VSWKAYLQVATSSEALVALLKLALKGLGVVVGGHMRFQVAALGKGGRTVRALERTLASVQATVRLEVTGLREGPVAARVVTGLCRVSGVSFVEGSV
jgi:hypothetical protein